MAEISEKTVNYIAKLARLKLDPAEAVSLQRSMQDIINYIEKLNELDTTGVEPFGHVQPVANHGRSDEVKPSLQIDDVLGNAPDRAGNFFRVPRIVE